MVVSSFVTNLMPDAFLGVQARLVRGQVLQMQVRVDRHIVLDQGSFVPGSSIHPQMDDFASPPLAQTPQKPT